MSDDHTHETSGARPPSGERPPQPEQEVSVGAARVAVTDDRGAAPPAQPARLQEPVREEPMPKTGMQIPSPGHHEMFDCTIIGGGPTGLFAAFYAGMREMSVKIVDSLGDLGGQVSALYPEKYIYDVGGLPQIKGKDLVAACVEQAMQFGPSVCLGERVETLERQPDDTFILTTDKGHHHSKSVIISAGIGAFAPRKLPNMPELDALEGKSIFYFVRDLDDFRDKNLLIVGGGDSAMDWALNLEPVAKSTTLIHRRDRWRAHEDTVQRVLNSSTKVKTFYEVRNVQRDNGTIKGVTIFDNRTQAEETLPVDRIILSLGFIANLGPIKDWVLDIVDGGIAVDGTMATNLRGVFAAGDVARFTGKLNLIATGFGEAAIAANYAKAYIDPSSRVFPGHSSERSDPHP
jgi:thioredoxin reductase (NADPH)